jgi:hypothetical protein
VLTMASALLSPRYVSGVPFAPFGQNLMVGKPWMPHFEARVLCSSALTCATHAHTRAHTRQVVLSIFVSHHLMQIQQGGACIHLRYHDIARPLVCYSHFLKLWRKRFAMAAPVKATIDASITLVFFANFKETSSLWRFYQGA